MEATLAAISLSGYTQVACSAVAVFAVLCVEVPRSLGLTDLKPLDVVRGGGRFLCHCAPEAAGLFAVMIVSLVLRLRGDTETFASPLEAEVWAQIKVEWPVLMGADTLLNVQAMLRLVVFLSVAARTAWIGAQIAGRALMAGVGSVDAAFDLLKFDPRRNKDTDSPTSPLSGTAAALFLCSMLARSRMNTVSAGYTLEGPLALGGHLPGFCELAMIPILAAVGIDALQSCSRGAGTRLAGAAGFSAWVASRHYLNLDGNPSIDSLFVLAHVLEFFAALAFLGHAVWTSTRDSSGKCKHKAFLGFVHVLMALQQGLSAYYFLTAFIPSESTVGSGRPFCVLIMSNLLQLAAYLASAALFFGGQCCSGNPESGGVPDDIPMNPADGSQDSDASVLLPAVGLEL